MTIKKDDIQSSTAGESSAPKNNNDIQSSAIDGDGSSAPKDTKGASKKNPTTNNALKHGVYAKVPILFWENADERDQLHKQYRDELQPDGPFEEAIVVEIVEAVWLRRRLKHHFAMKSLSDPLVDELEQVAEKGGTSAEDYICERVKSMRPASGARPPQCEQQLRDRVEELGDSKAPDPLGLGKVLETVEQTRRRMETMNIGSWRSLLDRFYRSDDLDEYLRRLERLDARIDKGMARLVRAKEFKRQYVPKAVEATRLE